MRRWWFLLIEKKREKEKDKDEDEDNCEDEDAEDAFLNTSEGWKMNVNFRNNFTDKMEMQTKDERRERGSQNERENLILLLLSS